MNKKKVQNKSKGSVVMKDSYEKLQNENAQLKKDNKSLQEKINKLLSKNSLEKQNLELSFENSQGRRNRIIEIKKDNLLENNTATCSNHIKILQNSPSSTRFNHSTKNSKKQKKIHIEYKQESLKNFSKFEVELEKKFNEASSKLGFYIKNNEKQNNYIQNYKSFITEMRNQICNHKEKLNIPINDMNNNEIINSLEAISDKVRELKFFVDDNYIKLKKINDSNDKIKNKLIEMKKIIDKKDIFFLLKFKENNIELIDKISHFEDEIKKMGGDGNYFEEKNSIIDKEIKEAKQNFSNFIQQIQRRVDSKELKSSWLLIGAGGFGDKHHLFKSRILIEEDGKCDKPDILHKNWEEKCFIKEEYDLHDITFDLKAVGLPDQVIFQYYNMPFDYDKIITIEDVEINGESINYQMENHILNFVINLKNEETINIHLKYKEINKKGITKKGKYSLSKKLAGHKAEFILILEDDFKIVNFNGKEEFQFEKNEEANNPNTKEYKWKFKGGVVSSQGQEVEILFSKSEAKWHFSLYEKIINITTENICNTTLIIPFYFDGGNNELLKININSNQTDKIITKKDKQQYEANFIDTENNIGEFMIEGAFTNKCTCEKGWTVELTDQQIDENIPEEYKTEKNKFLEWANKIINEYRKERENEAITITDPSIIGKWVKKNINNNICFLGRNEISSSQVYSNKAGENRHLTNLFNALVYSLGYKVIYVSGYLVDKDNNTFTKKNNHDWSLVKIDDKWLPFDATCGIFLGKLPVNHIFKNYFGKGIQVFGDDDIDIDLDNRDIKGNYLG